MTPENLKILTALVGLLQSFGTWPGINNPCPPGFRLPTNAEWEIERLSWTTNNSAGAFASPLKLVAAGARWMGDGTITNVGGSGSYWSSTVDSSNHYVYAENFDSATAQINSGPGRA